MDLHRLAELRSIAFHRQVMERARVEPAVVERARARVRGWIERGEPHPVYTRDWSRILELPREAMEARVVEDSESMRALRQVTPFAGALPPKERWAIWRQYAALRSEA
ncbi:MAG TPA: hypothetical protein VHS09_07415 [Polyangiaceae bacterium]|nr:hypothetical protein [Polyangiaceae bacterium]